MQATTTSAFCLKLKSNRQIMTIGSVSCFSITMLLFMMAVKCDEDNPHIEESWIFAMIVLGFLGFFILLLAIIIAIYQTYKTMKESIEFSNVLIALDFAVWIFNAAALFEWAFFRTNLFIDLNVQRCKIIYISNYFFYMLAKYCLHILLLYRLHAAFKGTLLHLNTTFTKIFGLIITVDFIIFVSLWMNVCVENVKIGVSQTFEICTLYNNDSNSEITLYEKLWPMLFGAQDFFVGIATLIIFIYKINQLTSSTSHTVHDIETEAIVRKLFILGTISIFSTFIFFTFAIPFYGNLTFLLPLDSLINSFCVLLLLKWSDSVYKKICCGIDLCLLTTFKHEKDESSAHSTTNFVMDGIEIVLDDYCSSNVTNNKTETTEMVEEQVLPIKLYKSDSNFKHPINTFRDSPKLSANISTNNDDLLCLSEPIMNDNKVTDSADNGDHKTDEEININNILSMSQPMHKNNFILKQPEMMINNNQSNVSGNGNVHTKSYSDDTFILKYPLSESRLVRTSSI
eukprot:455409_1